MADESAKTGEITEVVRVAQPPPVQGRRPYRTPVRTATLRMRGTEEYVSAGPRLWAVNYLRTLSWAIDDITADFGDDLYERMMMDPQVGADVDTYVLSVLADGMQFAPAVDDFTVDPATGAQTPNAEAPMAKVLCEYFRRILGGLCMPFQASEANDLYWAIRELLMGAAMGHRVAEKIYALPENGPDKGRYVLRALKPKPRRTLSMVVDVFNNVLGFIALIPGQAMPVLMNGLVVDPKYVPNLLGRSKFALFTFRPKDCDPRGTSLIRKAYIPWFEKQQLRAERLKWYGQLAGGSVVGFTAEDATAVPLLDETGQPVPDGNGDPIMLKPSQEMVEQLVNWQNGTAAAFPYGSKVQMNYPPAESGFDAGMDAVNREITTAILGSSRMVHEAEHGSRADSETSQDVAGLRIHEGRMALIMMLVRDICVPLITLNWGPEYAHLCPRISMSGTEAQDWPATLTAIAAAQQAGYWQPSQYRALDAKAGLPIRTEDMAKVKAAQAEQEASAAAKPEPAPQQNPVRKIRYSFATFTRRAA
jgi:hypothetical protein